MKGDVRFAVYTGDGCSDFELESDAHAYAKQTVELRKKIGHRNQHAVIVRWVSDGACFQNTGIIEKYGEAP